MPDDLPAALQCQPKRVGVIVVVKQENIPAATGAYQKLQ